MNVTVVRKHSSSVKMAGPDPIVMGENTPNDWAILKRVTDGAVFVYIPHAASAKAAHEWAIYELKRLGKFE